METWRERRGRPIPSRPLRACMSLSRSRSQRGFESRGLPPLSRLLSPSLVAGGEPYHLLLHHASREESKRWPRRRQHLVGVMGMGSREVATVDKGEAWWAQKKQNKTHAKMTWHISTFLFFIHQIWLRWCLIFLVGDSKLWWLFHHNTNSRWLIINKKYILSFHFIFNWIILLKWIGRIHLPQLFFLDYENYWLIVWKLFSRLWKIGTIFFGPKKQRKKERCKSYRWWP